ncbi:MAG: redoxin domain-containing protein [Chloroflexota bacterium]|nr:redoxin domain-containing protein [Chloroflexota bacterium]
MRRLRWLIVPVVLVPVAWLFLQGIGQDPRALGSQLVGRQMPTFTLRTIDGRTVSSESLRGRPVVLNFWASWCIPACVDEHAVLIDAARRAGGRAQFVGVLYQDRVDDALGFLQRYGETPYPHLIDDGSRLAIDFGVTGPPETYFIDAAGVVRAKQFGPLTAEAMRAKLATIGVTDR